MGKATKKIRKNKQRQAEKDLSEKVGMFDRLPNKCTACEDPFDKKDKEMVKSWFVIVRNKEQTVNLYCPPCWEAAQNVLNDFRNRIEKREEEVLK